MKNWKTFLSGLALAVTLNGTAFGIPPKVAAALQAVAAVFLGSASKDKDVTGAGSLAKRVEEK